MSTKLKKQIYNVEEGEWITIPQEDIFYNWCCDCNLRHLEEYRIVKNKKGAREIQRRSWRDTFATDLRRIYERKVGKL